MSQLDAFSTAWRLYSLDIQRLLADLEQPAGQFTTARLGRSVRDIVAHLAANAHEMAATP